MNTRLFHRLLGAILWMGIASSLWAQPKNILYLRFEQKHISRAIPIADDSVFSVYYRLVSPKPSYFHGIEIWFSYDKTILRPVDKGVSVAGTAAANADFAYSGVDAIKGQYHVAILASQMFDTTNHLLFKYRASVLTNASIDSAAISIFKIDTAFNSRIDSVVIENAGGKDEAGFFPFAVAYLDSVKPVVHQKHQLTLHSDSVVIQSDSIKTLTITIDSAKAVNITNAVFSAHFDTSKIDVLSIQQGSILKNATVTSEIAADSLRFLFSADRLDSAGDLLQLTIRARHRTDTTETRLIHPRLTVMNVEDSISNILYDLNPIIVQGKKDSVVDTTHSLVAQKAAMQNWIQVAGRHLVLTSAEFSPAVLRVYSITGALVALLPVTNGESVVPQSISPGLYLLKGAQSGELSNERTFFFIIH